MTNSSPDFQIRPIAQGDREQWEILFLAYGVFYETDFSPEILDGVWTWLMNPSHPIKAWVASGDDGLVGFAHLRFHDDTFTAGPAWFLDDLFTSPQARGKGVATAIITALQDHAARHGGGTLRWITGAENTTAQSLYDSLATRTSWVMYEQEIEQSN